MHILIHMLMKFVRILYFICCLIIRYLFSFHREKILIQQGSKYNHSIIISQCGSRRIMRFNSLSSGAQSQIDLNRIDYPYVEYIQLMIISLIYYPLRLNEKNFLIIGLGGGTLPRALRKLYPMSTITIIEIDPLVNEMAKKYFYFKEDSKMKVFIGDGRNFLNNLSDFNFYDIIYFDAYDSINDFPSNMITQEFFLQLKNHLNINGGLLIGNLVCIYQSYVNIRQTINSVFGFDNIITFRSTELFNIVLIASSSNQNSLIINQNSDIINHIKQTLSINVHSLLKTKQKQLSNHDCSSKIYTDRMENIDTQENMSLIQFIDVV